MKLNHNHLSGMVAATPNIPLYKQNSRGKFPHCRLMMFAPEVPSKLLILCFRSGTAYIAHHPSMHPLSCYHRHHKFRFDIRRKKTAKCWWFIRSVRQQLIVVYTGSQLRFPSLQKPTPDAFPTNSTYSKFITVIIF